MPREGCKLLVRNSKGSGQEEYYVDSVEVVSFGHSFFFRSQERPKSFLVPVSDYEILEQKETRMSLKNVAPERSIKIGGGRGEGPPRAPREAAQEAEAFEPQEREHPADRPPMDRDRKRDNNKRRRGRRGGGGGGGGGRPEGSMNEMREQPPIDEPFPIEDSQQVAAPRDSVPQMDGEHKAPSFISKLFPPPPTLIKDTLSRYKTAEAEGDAPFPKEEKFDEPLFDNPISTEKADSEEEEPPFED